MRGVLQIQRGTANVYLQISPVLARGHLHKVTVTREENGKNQVSNFTLDSEGYVTELLKQLAPLMAFSSTLTTGTVMDVIKRNRLEELYG